MCSINNNRKGLFHCHALRPPSFSLKNDLATKWLTILPSSPPKDEVFMPSFQKPKKMAETYAQLPADGNQGLVIRFYGYRAFATEPLFIGLDQPLSCEQVCMKSARHLSSHLGKYFYTTQEKIIGPLLLPMFGLYAANHLTQQWIPDGRIFNTDTVSGRQEFYFRIRVQPVIKNIPKGIFADYLFWQVSLS